MNLDEFRNRLDELAGPRRAPDAHIVEGIRRRARRERAARVVVACALALAVVVATTVTVRTLDHGNDVAVTSESSRAPSWSTFCRRAQTIEAGLNVGRAGDEPWWRMRYRQLALASPDPVVRGSIIGLVHRPTVTDSGDASALRQLALVNLAQLTREHCGSSAAGVFGTESPFATAGTTTTTSSPPPPTSTSAPPSTTPEPATTDVTPGTYVNGGPTVPHYYVSLSAGTGGTVDGPVGFLYQDGQTKTVFTFSGTAGGGVMNVTSSPPETGLSITYGPDSLQLGECTSYLQFATSLAACSFVLSPGGISGG